MKDPWQSAADRTEQILAKHKAAITLGGEPTYVPLDPQGAEWNTTAVGPTKLKTAYRYIQEVAAEVAPKGLCFFSPGKSYPGEPNPRWTLHLLWRRDGRALMKSARQQFGTGEEKQSVSLKVLRQVQAGLSAGLKLEASWLRGLDARESTRLVGVLPLDHEKGRWLSARWLPARQSRIELLQAEGPAGLRLPLSRVPEGISRRALVLEVNGGCLDVFLPPLRQKPFEQLLRKIGEVTDRAGLPFRLQGYVPSDEKKVWEKLSAAPDPGVLEVNIPACANLARIRPLDPPARRRGRAHRPAPLQSPLGGGIGRHRRRKSSALRRSLGGEECFFSAPRPGHRHHSLLAETSWSFLSVHRSLCRLFLPGAPARRIGPARFTIWRWPTATSKIWAKAITAISLAKLCGICIRTAAATRIAVKLVSINSGASTGRAAVAG